MSITEERLDEIRERLDAATPGPWRPDNDEPGYVIAPDDPSGWDGYLIASTVDHDGGLFVQEHNAELIAHAPQDLADLLAEVERLRDELAKAREVTDDMIERAALVDLNMGLKFRGLGPVKSLEEIKPILGEEGPYRLRSTMRAALIAVLGGGKNV